MKFTDVKNPRWANEEHTALDCEVNFEAIPEEYVNFTAVASGDYQHTHEIFARAVAGDFGEVAEFEPKVLTLEEVANTVRVQRDALLSSTDWTQLPDVPQSTKDLWSPYRQALRDITEQEGFPNNVVYPTAPTS